MRLLIGAGTPREAATKVIAYLLFVCTEQAVVIILIAASGDDFAVVMIEAADDPA